MFTAPLFLSHPNSLFRRVHFSARKNKTEPLPYLRSDTNAPPLRQYMDASAQVLADFENTYATDEITRKAFARFSYVFGKGTVPFFLTTGTAANIQALKFVLTSRNAIVCGKDDHIVDLEAGAPFSEIGCAVVMPHTDANGHFTVSDIEQAFKEYNRFGNKFNNRASIISICQPTMMGTIWDVDQIKALSEYAHKNNMLFHMDGARLWHVAARTGKSLKALTTDLGVDILSLGGTKIGMDEAEAIVFLPVFFKNYPKVMNLTGELGRQVFAEDFYRQLKQAGHLTAKYGKRPNQFMTAFKNRLGVKTARKSNWNADQLQQRLEQQLDAFHFNPFRKSQRTNALYLTLPKSLKKEIAKHYGFFTWLENDPKDTRYFRARLMPSWNVTKQQLQEFVEFLTTLLHDHKRHHNSS